MVDMQLSNDKLIIRGVKILVNELNINEIEASIASEISKCSRRH